MFTTDNTNGLDEVDEFTRYQNMRNFSDAIMEVAESGMTAAEIIAAVTARSSRRQSRGSCMRGRARHGGDHSAGDRTGSSSRMAFSE